jgi:hypothetical protein
MHACFLHVQVSTKRKEHLQKRKDKKKEVKADKLIKNLRSDDSDDEDAQHKVEQKLKLEEKMYVRFGEQAERPPLIRMDKPLKGLHKQVAHDSK